MAICDLQMIKKLFNPKSYYKNVFISYIVYYFDHKIDSQFTKGLNEIKATSLLRIFPKKIRKNSTKFTPNSD